MTPRLAVLVPTRNRPELARRAISSVAGRHPEVRVFVSDNSTSRESRQSLSTWIGAAGENVVLWATDDDMPMSDHWEWALARLLETTDIDNVAVLTDRMRFRRYGLTAVMRALRAAPGEIICYGFDTIDDWDPARPSVQLDARTRRLYRVSSTRLLRDFVDGQAWAWQTPRLQSVTVPREVFAELRQTRDDGRVFASYAPDYYFAFKVLALIPGFVLCDDGVNIQFGLPQSNGYAFQSGVLNDAARDVLRLAGGPLHYNSPYPSLITTANAIVHEYNVVRDEVGHDRMPPWPRPAVHALLENEARQMQSPAMQREVLDVIGADLPSAAPAAAASTDAVAPWRSVDTLVRHPVASFRVARHRLGLDGYLRRVVAPTWGEIVSRVLRGRVPDVLARAARFWPVTFSSLDEAIDSLEDTVPATRNATPPPGAEEILVTRQG